MSIVTVFLFAGPHNWFELRYFLMRLPVRFGRSRNFFLTAFVGLGVLTLAYVALPIVYNAATWSDDAWSTVIATWNTALIVWLGALIWLRGKQKPRANWAWLIPAGSRAVFVELAWTGFLQSRDRLCSSADCALVSGPASSSHETGVVACVSTLSLSVAVGAGGNDLAVVANLIACR